jgi:hypothetical protein
MRKETCQKCGNEFSLKAGNYQKHFQSCDGNYKNTGEVGRCIHCNEKFDLSDKPYGWMANHSRWCDKNPKLVEYKQVLLNRCVSQLNKPESIEKRSKSISKAHQEGKYQGSVQKALKTKRLSGTDKHSEESKKLISEKALASNHRRVLRSTRKYIKKDGTEVLLDSSWEEALAKRLDFLDVRWERPSSVKWVDDNNKPHNYFPDFYLPDYDLYLDPKNDIVYNMTINKIEKIMQILPNLKILRSLEECSGFNP